jgi:PEGA domain-containing protein
VTASRGHATQRPASTDRASRGVDGGVATVPPGSRPIDGHTPIGTAVPRGSVPTNTALFTRTGSVVGLYPSIGFYPVGYYGFPGFFAYSNYFFDPWYGGYADQTPSRPSIETGAIHLKITPQYAQVYVDGSYVGVVDDFDGVFQKLQLDSGAHRIEVRADGYEPLAFDVQVPRDRAITYRGALQKIP